MFNLGLKAELLPSMGVDLNTKRFFQIRVKISSKDSFYFSQSRVKIVAYIEHFLAIS
jgi:hypothetical protein